MSEEKFVLVSLEEDKAKKIADVLSNETSRKILDYLGEVKEASEGEISKKMGIPISTIHYNIQQLVQASLVESKEFRWSDKGREINIYRLAKKYVVIAPKGMSGLREKLRTILPIVFFGAVLSGAIQYVVNSRYAIPLTDTLTRSSEPILKSGSAPAVLEQDMASSIAQNVTTNGSVIINQIVPNYGLWFFLGILFAVALYLVFRKK